jgi:hypothetical protein
MPIVQNRTTAAHFNQGYGFNDLLRRLFFPGWPPTICIGGLVFFPWGTGPTFPIPCDENFRVLTLPGGAGRQFIGETGDRFAAAVAEVGHVSLAEAKRAVAEAAGIKADELAKLSVKDVGRKIFDKAQKKLGLHNVQPAQGETINSYFEKMARSLKEIDPEKAVADLSKQTGVASAKLGKLPLGELGDLLDMSGQPPGTTMAYSSGTTVCVSGNGQIGCTRVHGWLEGALWGGIIGGAVGGGVGAAIGAVIGAIIGWLF